MTQNLDTFVVQIRNPISHDISGTGFVISIDGLIATCWHVVEIAGVDPAQTGARVNIGLPGKSTDYSALVVTGLKTDDVSILQLEQILPFGWSSAILGSSESVAGHSFKTKGYSVLGHYTGVNAEGRILGSLEVESELPPQFPPLQLFSQQIDRGMSGAPILDLDIDRIVGMTSEIWIPPRGFRHRDTVFAIRTESLKACYPQLILRQPVRHQPATLLASVARVSELLHLLDFR